jgi:hypothetical protein
MEFKSWDLGSLNPEDIDATNDSVFRTRIEQYMADALPLHEKMRQFTKQGYSQFKMEKKGKNCTKRKAAKHLRRSANDSEPGTNSS